MGIQVAGKTRTLHYLHIPRLVDTNTSRVVADDILTPVSEAEQAAPEEMRTGCHYDYQSQKWVDGHDHAHYLVGDPDIKLLFCGSDIDTCCGKVK